MEGEITIEYGASDVNKGSYTDGIRYAEALREQHSIDTKLTINLVPYDGVEETVLGSAKRSSYAKIPSIKDLELGVRMANDFGMRFKVALNGGMLIPGEIDFSDARYKNDLRVMEILADETARSGIPNIVVTYRDEVLETIREKFPGILVAASAIRYAVPRTKEDHIKKYTQDLVAFDQIVVIPQHSTVNFLERFSDQSDKIVVFPFLACGQHNLMECQKHYEYYYSGVAQHEGGVSSENPFLCGSTPLAFKKRTIEGLIKRGVSKFKLPRNPGSLEINLRGTINVYMNAQHSINAKSEKAAQG